MMPGAEHVVLSATAPFAPGAVRTRTGLKAPLELVTTESRCPGAPSVPEHPYPTAHEALRSPQTTVAEQAIAADRAIAPHFVLRSGPCR